MYYIYTPKTVENRKNYLCNQFIRFTEPELPSFIFFIFTTIVYLFDFIKRENTPFSQEKQARRKAASACTADLSLRF